MFWMQRFVRYAWILAVVFLAACSTSPRPGGEPAPIVTPPAPAVVSPPATVTPPRPATPTARAAWQPLLAQAGAATQRGDYEQALALLERAQRIEPDSAEVYLGMARTHMAKGDSAQARVTAERGLLYCVSDAQCSALRAYTR